MIEAFLLKIIAKIMAKALIANTVKSVITAIEIYTKIESVSNVINAIRTSNDCKALGLFGVQVASDYLVDSSIDKILSIGNDKFTVERKKSGLFVASHYVPKFKIDDSSDIVNVFNTLGAFRPLSKNNQGTFKEVKTDIFSNTINNRFRKLN